MIDRAEILKQFDGLPDDALVSRAIVAAVTGVSERTLRRKKIFAEVAITERIKQTRVGDIRRLVRGDKRQAG